MPEKYGVTNHAVLRGRERVGLKGTGNKLRENVVDWCNRVIPQSEFIGECEEGHSNYRFREFKIVVSKDNSVITISYYNGIDYGLAEEINGMIRKKLLKELKTRKHELRKTEIFMHETEIKRLKSYNPKSVETIEKELQVIKKNLSVLRNRVDDIDRLAKRYKITLQEEKK